MKKENIILIAVCAVLSQFVGAYFAFLEVGYLSHGELLENNCKVSFLIMMGLCIPCVMAKESKEKDSEC